MPLPLIANTVRVAVVMKAPGVTDTVVNVVHLENPSAASIPATDTIFQPIWHTFVEQEVQSIFAVDHVTYTQLDGSASIDMPWTAGAMVNPSELFPMQACIVASWRTALAGRAHRGRTFMGPTGPNRINPAAPNEVEPSSIINIATRGTTLIADLSMAGTNLKVASYVHSTAEPVTRIVVNPLICTQRRRVNGK